MIDLSEHAIFLWNSLSWASYYSLVVQKMVISTGHHSQKSEGHPVWTYLLRDHVLHCLQTSASMRDLFWTYNSTQISQLKRSLTYKELAKALWSHTAAFWAVEHPPDADSVQCLLQHLLSFRRHLTCSSLLLHLLPSGQCHAWCCLHRICKSSQGNQGFSVSVLSWYCSLEL